MQRAPVGLLSWCALLLVSAAVPIAAAEPLSDDQLLELVQRQTFRYFYDFAHPDCGLARERSAPARRGDAGLADLEHIVTTGGTGFGLMAFPIAVERQWIARQDAVDHLLKVVRFLERVPRFHGMWAHWYFGHTGKVRPFSAKDDGGDIVESAFLIQGLLTIRQYFTQPDPKERELRATVDRLWRAADWQWYRNGRPWLYWHWSPRYGFAMDMPVVGFNEAMIVYVLAAASPTHPVPAKLYDTGWARTDPNRFPAKAHYADRLRLPEKGCGGPLFWTHYSHLGLSPYLTDRYVARAGFKDYAQRHRVMASCCYQWCRTHGYPPDCWGLTSSDDPVRGYRVHAASSDDDNGTIAPTAAISSIAYTPRESLAFIRFLWREHRQSMWTELGWRDAFNLRRDWFAPAHLAIDQGPIIVMIENHRTGLCWRLFMSSPEIAPALKRLKIERTRSQ